MQYKIVFQSTSDLLADEVNERIQEGWIPLGGVCSGNKGAGGAFSHMYQAMTKDSEDSGTPVP